MKTNKFLVIGMGVLVSSTIFGGRVYADDPTPAESTAVIDLTPGDGEVPPDPVDPILPVDPPTGNIGLLTIDAVSSFSFPETTLAGGATVVEASVPTGTRLGAQVSDRRGEEIGWNLTVRATDFVDGEKTLKGAYITIPKGQIKGTLGADPALAPIAADTINLANTDTIIMQASSTQGRGSWVNEFEEGIGDEKVTLTKPAGGLIGSYTSTLTWTLADAP